MSEQIKVMYFGQLPEGCTHAAFRERWRRHGALAMRLPFWSHMARYVQCDVLTEGEAGLSAEHLAMTRPQYGGVGMIWFRDAAALEDASASPNARVMAEDEVPTFGRELGGRLVPTVEHVVIDGGAAPASPITLIAIVHRRAGVGRASFGEQWRALGAQLAAIPDVTRHVTRYVQNHTIMDADFCDGFVEFSFASPEALSAYMAALAATDLLEQESAFIDASKLEIVITAAHELFHETAAPSPATAHREPVRTA